MQNHAKMTTTTGATNETKIKAAPPTEHAKVQNKAQNQFYTTLNNSDGKFHRGIASLVKFPGGNFPVEPPRDTEVHQSLKIQAS
eukprot:2149742-Ditylum_brightwellii.AAC.1